MVTPLATCHMPLRNTPHVWASSCLKQFSLWTSSFCNTTLASSYISCQTWISAEFFTATPSFNVEVPQTSSGNSSLVHLYSLQVYIIQSMVLNIMSPTIYMLFLTSSFTSWNLDISTWISYWHFKTKQVENSTINHPSLNCSESLWQASSSTEMHISPTPPHIHNQIQSDSKCLDLTHKIHHKCLYFWSSLLPL